MKNTLDPMTKKIGKLNGARGYYQIRATRIGEPSERLDVDNPARVFDFWKKTVCEREWYDPEKEALIVMSLSIMSRVMAWHIVSLGTRESAVWDYVGVFQPVILAGCSRIVIIHNHPSGNVSPSRPDYMMTKQIADAGGLLGIEVLDHVIVSDSEFCSIRAARPDVLIPEVARFTSIRRAVAD